MSRVFLTAIAPILVVTAAGYLLARLRLVEDPRPLSRVATHALLPVLAFSALARSEPSGAHIVALVVCARNVAVLQSSMPTAIGAALVAVEFNLRPALVSGAVLVTTLGSAVTLSILLVLLAG
jgi:predicted permease